MLGGVEVPHELGLQGHSDGDVVLHAVCDALLGAAGLGGIGRHFPPEDPALQGADSAGLLGAVERTLGEHGFAAHNVDVTIVAEAPRLDPHVERMRERIGQILAIAPARVNVKATTAEGLGPVGAGEAISALAVATLEDRP
jgi:2-C-methyl-D-erythritol 2,4-cyclodiphosphate synthase